MKHIHGIVFLQAHGSLGTDTVACSLNSILSCVLSVATCAACATCRRPITIKHLFGFLGDEETTVLIMRKLCISTCTDVWCHQRVIVTCPAGCPDVLALFCCFISSQIMTHLIKWCLLKPCFDTLLYVHSNTVDRILPTALQATREPMTRFYRRGRHFVKYLLGARHQRKLFDDEPNKSWQWTIWDIA